MKKNMKTFSKPSFKVPRCGGTCPTFSSQKTKRAAATSSVFREACIEDETVLFIIITSNWQAYEEEGALIFIWK